VKRGVLLLSIGDELLDGRTQNTNASWLGEQLREAGVPVAEVRCVSDNLKDIIANLKEGEKYPLVITTGGLGPTNDDRTMEAVAKKFRRPLAGTKISLEHVRSRYEARGLPLTEARKRLALIPKGAKVLQNPTGTAPGVHLKIKKTDFYILPGPPNECRPIFTKDILPTAAKKIAEKKLLRREFWRTFGKGESDIYHKIETVVAALEEKFPETVTFGIHISFPCIDVTFESWKVKGQKSPSAEEIDRAAKSISESLAEHCFTRARENLVDVVARQLKERGKTLATAESCTGGLLSKMITDLSGSSEYFLGGAVSYHNNAKEILLDVPNATLRAHGAVSEPTVKVMAENMRKKLGADFCLSLSGVSGPGGGSAEKPVGTIRIALSDARSTKTLHQVILGGKGSRDQNRTIAAYLALDLLRNALRE
jgi:nicotinamide-nucleotide amidase